MQDRKGCTQQLHLGGGMSEINMTRADGWIGSGEHEFACNRESVLVSACKHERAGVDHERGVEAGGNIAIDRNARPAGKAVNQLSGSHYAGVDPVDVSKITPCGVVIDINEKTSFQAFETSAPYAVTLQHDDGIIRRHRVSMNRAVRKRKVLVNARNAVVHHDIGLFTHDPQNLTESQSRADSIPVGPGVRGHDEALTGPNFL